MNELKDNLKNKTINFIKSLKEYFTSSAFIFFLIYYFIFYLISNAYEFLFVIIFSYIFEALFIKKRDEFLISAIISTILLFAFGYTYHSEFTKYSNIRKVNKIKTFKDEFYVESCNKECKIYEYFTIPKCKSYVIVDKNYDTSFLGRVTKDKVKNKIICYKD